MIVRLEALQARENNVLTQIVRKVKILVVVRRKIFPANISETFYKKLDKDFSSFIIVKIISFYFIKASNVCKILIFLAFY